ncbi:N-acylmannosamine kinase [Deinococcus metalli]|uniref:N-acetylmannosamine kinase n=1 Tax=Deinococcus metalli TaxID=1141878 RepID=A0A7W8KKM5_9DEIO|nr:ROK family protein [Deinococcus metalli]MBB5378284.1 N-acylmannosamine kinase [Deinococcus metalli]GHF57415.1 N-acetylmannosamine kinase [Deinococcus metalli]
MSGALLALDVGGTSMRAALVVGGRITERVEAATPKPSTPDAVIPAAVALARPLAARATALGVACAGAVAQGRVTATATHTFPGWVDIPLAQRLSGGLGLPCRALNDARAAAWGEAQAGAGRGAPEFMFVTVSTGVGAGLILGGRLHLAGNGLDAELGFVSVPAAWAPGTPVPPLGALGPLEFESSGTALNARAHLLGHVDARALCDAAEAGDERAEAAYSRSAALIAWKSADVAALLGITRVALGGSVGLRSGYLDRVRMALEHFPPRYRPEIVHAELGADAGLIGAALWAGRPAD